MNRRLGGAGRRDIRGGVGKFTYLVPPFFTSDFTFARASEASAVDPRVGWSFADLVTPYPGSDVRRVLDNGNAVLIEGARTNLIPNGRALASWSSLSGHTITADALAGPDGIVAADRAQVSSGGFVGQTLGDQAGVLLSGSAYLQAGPTHSGLAQMFVGSGQPGTTAAGLTVDGTWRRFALTYTGSGIAISEFLFPGLDGTDRTAFGGIGAKAHDLYHDLSQFEQGAFPSSPIRTAGATGTRANEDLNLASTPDRMRLGRWAVDVWPLFSSSEVPSAGAVLFGFGTNAGHRFEITAAARVAAVEATIVRVQSSVLTWSRYQRLTLVIDPSAGTLSVSGATSGNGLSTGTSFGWPTGQLDIGDHAVGGAHAFAVISRPRAA